MMPLRGFTRPIDPYRILFPIGLMLGGLGALLWPLYLSGVLVRYPGGLHPAIMMGGFQLCMATGFLMTAAPRFTGTDHATLRELNWALRLGVLLVLGAAAAALGIMPERFYLLLSVLMVTFLAVYFGRRWVARVHSPPASFLFVGTGLACGMLGSLLLFIFGSSQPLGRALFYHAMMLSLVLGVGSRLVTANLGWMQNPIIPISQLGKSKSRWRGVSRAHWVSFGLCVLFVTSFFVEVYASVLLGRGLRALLATSILLFSWKLYRLPRVRTHMAFWLWCSGWCVLLGIWLYAVTPAHAVHGAHLMFIGGFSLMIFMIASRLTLSHGGFDLIFESRSPAYGWIGGLLIIAALSRTIAGWVAPSDFWRWILASSLIFLSALGLWISVFLGRILRIQKERNSGYGRT